MTNHPKLYAEQHRPQLHYSPAINWMNDPNGLVYLEGVYHLFYQYNPSDKVWGNMNWGHATSTDLIHWQQQEIAIPSDPDGLGYIFSGSAVVDWNNSSGLQVGDRPPLIAIFTHNSRYDYQVQSIAYSNDQGNSWQIYAGNPVIENLHYKDFRDPKVFWYEPDQVWIMCLAVADRIFFYRSSNLIEWQFSSEFKKTDGENKGVWECPDLIRLPVKDLESNNSDSDEQEQKEQDYCWVLIVSIDRDAPNTGGSATQYIIGDFDGRRFTTEQKNILWLDHGSDNYAGVTWSDIPEEDGRCILLGWMNNWAYAVKQPTVPWKGAMTLPRELNLVKTMLGYRLACVPVREYSALIGPKTESTNTLPTLCNIELQLDVASNKAGITLKLFNDLSEAFNLHINHQNKAIVLDRSQAAFGIDAPSFIVPLSGPLLFPEAPEEKRIHVKIVKDVASIEVFVNHGLVSFTTNYFTQSELDRFSIEAIEGLAELGVSQLEIHELKSIWS